MLGQELPLVDGVGPRAGEAVEEFLLVIDGYGFASEDLGGAGVGFLGVVGCTGWVSNPGAEHELDGFPLLEDIKTNHLLDDPESHLTRGSGSDEADVEET